MGERVERPVDDDRVPLAAAGDVGEVVRDERVDAQRELGGLVVGGEQRARLVGPEQVPPQPDDPLRVRVAHGGARGRRVRGQLGALALDAAQDGVDDAVAGARLGELDRLGDRRVRRDAVEEQQLVEPELQRGADARLEPPRRPLGDEVVEA